MMTNPTSLTVEQRNERARVTVVVSGLTGSGKSAIYGEIVLALQALGVTVEHEDEAAWTSECRMTHADWQSALDLYQPVVTMAEKNISRAPSDHLTSTDRLREALEEMLKAQKVQPYRGWNMTELNKAAGAARELLGFPSIRELNPDIASIQDAASANTGALRALISTPAPISGEREALKKADAFFKMRIEELGQISDEAAEVHAAILAALQGHVASASSRSLTANDVGGAE